MCDACWRMVTISCWTPRHVHIRTVACKVCGHQSSEQRQFRNAIICRLFRFYNDYRHIHPQSSSKSMYVKIYVHAQPRTQLSLNCSDIRKPPTVVHINGILRCCDWFSHSESHSACWKKLFFQWPVCNAHELSGLKKLIFWTYAISTYAISTYAISTYAISTYANSLTTRSLNIFVPEYVSDMWPGPTSEKIALSTIQYTVQKGRLGVACNPATWYKVYSGLSRT